MLTHVNAGRANRALLYVPDKHMDEALWAAYHRHDKRAVTKELLQRYLQPPRNHCARRRQLSHG
jgi:hypothetical protein